MRHTARRWIPFVVLLACVWTSALAHAEETLTVFAAASLAKSFKEIGKRFESEHPGTKVRFNFAGSQQLAAQIEQRVPVDVFASADERWMSYVVERGLAVDGGSVFARNRLTVVIPKTNPGRIGTLNDLSRRGVKLVLAAEAVPAGSYARRMLRALAREPGFPPDFAERTLRNLVSNEENVRGVLGKVQLGEADAGVVYRSDVTQGARRYVSTLEIPEPANPVATYPIVTLRDGRAEAARAFVALVRSEWGQGILQRHGFLPAP
jgi:molybdate transport system substrate-binding protein